MAPRSLQAEESWTSLHRSEASDAVSNDDFNYPSDISLRDDTDADNETPSKIWSHPAVPSIRDQLHPLRVMADRVGNQVEQFASSLDRFETKLSKENAEAVRDSRSVLPLVQTYKQIAADTVKRLRVRHGSDERRLRQFSSSRALSRLKVSRSASGSRTSNDREGDGQNATDADDLRQWEVEEQTWDLFESMIQLEYPAPNDGGHKDLAPNHARPAPSPVHQLYATEEEIWSNFLATDDLAWERNTVVTWLERTADQSGEGIDQMIEHLESDADRSAGIVAHSWLYTREAIKNQKRLRTWPRAFEPDEPGLDISLMNSAKTESLVTQLDPDAYSRQARALEDQDMSFERAVWLACWQMLRRGKSWDFIRDWCAEKAEFWRAAALYPSLDVSQLSQKQESDWQSQQLWRKTCALLAKDGGIDEYERAVYGLLSGYLPGTLKVSRNWYDQLYVHYKSYLVHAFERYLKNNFSSRMTSGLAAPESIFNFSTFAGQRAFSGNQLVEKLKLSEETKHEALEPFTMLQGSLIAGSFDDFVFKHGILLCKVANSTEKSKILPALPESEIETAQLAQINLQDYDFLRVVSHMVLIYQLLGHRPGDKRKEMASESFIVAYVDFLRRAGKQQLLPLYSAHLSRDRSLECLGRQLPFVQENTERSTMLKLMQDLKINIPSTLSMQLRMIIDDSPPDDQYRQDFPALSILDNSGNTAERIPSISATFLGNGVSSGQLDLINGFAWYKLLDGHWHRTMATGVTIFKYLLRHGALEAGIKMANETSLRSISIEKTPAMLGQPVDLTEFEGLEPGDLDEDDENYEAAILAGQARSFSDFENLFTALKTIHEWVIIANQISGASMVSPLQVRPHISKFKVAFRAVEDAMQPLLHGWLQHPRDELDELEFKQIRLACLPELVLAYNSILNYSCYFAGRDILKTSMDLAALIADEESDLAACLLEAGRMPEMVDSFAIVAKSMIQAEAKKPGDKTRDGRTLGLWTVPVEVNDGT